MLRSFLLDLAVDINYAACKGLPDNFKENLPVFHISSEKDIAKMDDFFFTDYSLLKHQTRKSKWLFDGFSISSRNLYC